MVGDDSEMNGVISQLIKECIDNFFFINFGNSFFFEGFAILDFWSVHVL